MDQETIRELTGKLSRCEGGLQSPPAAAGLRAAPRPGTMGHPPDEPPAVRELEEAVRTLQDRIDRIEVRGMLLGVWEGCFQGKMLLGGLGGMLPGKDAPTRAIPQACSYMHSRTSSSPS